MYRQSSFIAYYFGWSREDIMGLSHRERVRYCDEISRINSARNKDQPNIFEVNR